MGQQQRFQDPQSTRMTADEARAVMGLYDRRFETPSAPSAAPSRSPSSEEPAPLQPSVADVAEVLGTTEEEIAALLRRVRTPQPPPAPLRPTSTSAASAHRPTVRPVAASEQHETVVPNHAGPYARVFAEFDRSDGEFRATWNTAACLFGPLWYLGKGLWLKAFLYPFALITLAAVTGGIGLIAIPLLWGILANYDYYLLERYGTQTWDKPRRSAAPRATRPAPATQAKEQAAAGLEEKIYVLRETFAKGLITETEYTAKRTALVREAEAGAAIQQLERARQLGILTDAEFEAKRRQLLGEPAPPARPESDRWYNTPDLRA